MADAPPAPDDELSSGPHNGVLSVNDPIIPPNKAGDAVNGYFPDVQDGAAFYAREGFQCVNGSALNSGTPYGQCVFCFVDISGNTWNFVVQAGKLYLWDLPAATFTDVTPTNIILGSSGTGWLPVYMTTFDNSVVVTDGVSSPWVLTNPGNAPVTATPIPWELASVVLSIGTTDTQVGVASYSYAIGDTQYIAPAVPGGLALPAGNVPQGDWQVYLVTESGSIPSYTVTKGAASGYSTEALAIAALPAVPAGSWFVGYFTLQTNAGAIFRPGTDALAGGASGNPAAVTNYYAGQNPPWSAVGPGVVYGGSIFFIVNKLSAQPNQTMILWSETEEPLVGYFQSPFDDTWNLTQTNPTVLWALFATNVGLFYFRQDSIGSISGAVGPDLATTATSDEVGINTGTLSPGAVCGFGTTIFFVDTQARAWQLPQFAFNPYNPTTTQPSALYLQYRSVLAAFGNVISARAGAFGIVEPNHNLYLLAIYAGDSHARPTVLYAFDGKTGVYCGRWRIAPQSGTGIGIEAMGLVIRSVQDGGSGNPELAILGAQIGGSSTSGFVWLQASPGANQWWDTNSTVGSIEYGAAVTTGRMGYDPNTMLNLDQATVTTGNYPYPVTLAVQTSNLAGMTPLSATPVTSSDGINRCIFGLDTQGRGPIVTVTAASTGQAVDKQFILYNVKLQARTLAAGLYDG